MTSAALAFVGAPLAFTRVKRCSGPQIGYRPLRTLTLSFEASSLSGNTAHVWPKCW